MKCRDDKKNERKLWLTKFLFAVIFVLVSLIYMKVSDNNKSFYTNKLLQDSFNFQSFHNTYDKLFGDKFKVKKDNEDLFVFNDNIIFSSKEKIDYYYKLNVGKEYAVPVLKPGIIVYVGNKDDLGNTIIVQGNDGVDIWYGNLVNSDFGMYDYVSKGDIIGMTIDDNLLLAFDKNGTFLTYEEYIK